MFGLRVHMYTFMHKSQLRSSDFAPRNSDSRTTGIRKRQNQLPTSSFSPASSQCTPALGPTKTVIQQAFSSAVGMPGFDYAPLSNADLQNASPTYVFIA